MPLDSGSIGAAYQRAYGRQPDQGEIDKWTQDQSAQQFDVDTLVFHLMQQVRADDAQDKRRDVITHAYQAKLHRAPTDGEVAWWDTRIKESGGQGGDDGARGRDEPYTYDKLMAYALDHDADQAATASPPPPPSETPAPQPTS